MLVTEEPLAAQLNQRKLKGNSVNARFPAWRFDAVETGFFFLHIYWSVFKESWDDLILHK